MHIYICRLFVLLTFYCVCPASNPVRIDVRKILPAVPRTSREDHYAVYDLSTWCAFAKAYNAGGHIQQKTLPASLVLPPLESAATRHKPSYVNIQLFSFAQVISTVHRAPLFICLNRRKPLALDGILSLTVLLFHLVHLSFLSTLSLLVTSVVTSHISRGFALIFTSFTLSRFSFLSFFSLFVSTHQCPNLRTCRL